MSEPGLPVSSLFIVENSRDIYRSWAHLRDSYLPALLGAIKYSDAKVLFLHFHPPSHFSSIFSMISSLFLFEAPTGDSYSLTVFFSNV
jgi:hypothetical protein